MKPSILALLIAAGAFGASTIYLAMQLDEERARADQVTERSRALAARIAELEKAREELESLDIAPVRDQPAPRPVPGAAVAAHEETRPESDRAPGSRPGPPPRSEAMVNMMRSQMRANLRRLHADLGEKLGLSKEDTNKLLERILDKQMAMVEMGRREHTEGMTPQQRAAHLRTQEAQFDTEISALVGADKAELYRQYQETLPARQELEVLSRQLEGNDVALSKDQRDRMVTALTEERQRVPAPALGDFGSREEYQAARNSWQEEYNERAATRSRGILTGDQQKTYDEYLQWNLEMRQRAEARRAARDGRPEGAPPR